MLIKLSKEKFFKSRSYLIDSYYYIKTFFELLSSIEIEDLSNKYKSRSFDYLKSTYYTLLYNILKLIIYLSV